MSKTWQILILFANFIYRHRAFFEYPAKKQPFANEKQTAVNKLNASDEQTAFVTLKTSG